MQQRIQRVVKALSLLLLVTTLTACIPGAFVVGAAASAIVYDRRGLDAIGDDLRISRTSYKLINADVYLKYHTRVVVTSFNRVVLIVGQVPTEEAKTKIQNIVNDVGGAKRVYNELIVSGNVSTLTRSSDTWITTKIKAQMLSTAGLYSSQIKVVTENGTVYLLGYVTRRQAQLATEVASHIQGVQRVVKLFEYEQ